MTIDEAIRHAEEVADRCAVTDGNRKCEKEHRQLAEWLKELKKLRCSEKPNNWIPCSERFPDADDCPMDCMVTRKSKFVGNYTDVAVAEKNGTWTHEDWDAIVIEGVAKCISTRDDNIIAWMPLPEPYKGGDDE